MAEESETQAIASPLSLLLEQATGTGADAEEILILSFTLDLGFFERTALGVAHALGARVTVVGDAGVVSHDPRGVRRAGRSYLAGLAACGGSFHPKLVVLVGQERATVAVGSGNLTMSGWQDNHEIWTVLRAGPDGVPSTVPEIARWLRDLGSAVRMSHHVGPALDRVAALLASFKETALGPRAVSPLWGPIIDQLPDGPVEELSVCSPFHDPGALALRRLVERLRPARLTVAIQPGLTVCDGPAVGAVVDSVGGEVLELETSRYRHGKLIEGIQGGVRWALTGSPNCSGALLGETRSGGNVELGLITTIDQTLMPEGSTLPAEQLHAHIYAPRPIPRPTIVLLGASRVEAGLEVLLTRPMKMAGRVELSAPEAQPDSWEHITELAEGDHAVTVARGVEGGSRVRVVGDGPDGPVESNTVFVADPARALRRPARAGEIRRTTEPFDLFRNSGLAERFVADLESLRAGRPVAPRMAAAISSASRDTGTHSYTAHGSWEDYLDECAGRIGNSLLRFALGLPHLADDAVRLGEFVPAAWDEELPDEGDFGLEDDQAEDVADREDPAPVVASLPSLTEQSAYVRGRYRNWATALASKIAAFGPLERVLALRLVLWTAAAGAWEAEDHGWIAAIGKAVEGLGATPEPPAEIEQSAASLAAVALSILRSRASRGARTDETRIFERAAKTVGYLLPGVDPRYVDEYTKLLDAAFGPAVQTPVVLELADEIVQADPLADAITALEEDHDIFTAHAHGRLLHLPGEFRNPSFMALTAVALAEAAAPVGAWAGSREKWALVVWNRPDVVTFTHDRVDRWTHYRLTGDYTPRVCVFADRAIDRRFVVTDAIAGTTPNGDVVTLLSSVELETPSPPECGQ